MIFIITTALISDSIHLRARNRDKPEWRHLKETHGPRENQFADHRTMKAI